MTPATESTAQPSAATKRLTRKTRGKGSLTFVIFVVGFAQINHAGHEEHEVKVALPLRPGGHAFADNFFAGREEIGD